MKLEIDITKMVEEISMQAKENQEEFVFNTLLPYCENILQMKINKEELKQILLKGAQKTSWIPCSERLPESDEDVLVTNGIRMYVGWIDSTDKGWRVDSESAYFMDDIVAWMPLPEPYKAESENEQ